MLVRFFFKTKAELVLNSAGLNSRVLYLVLVMDLIKQKYNLKKTSNEIRVFLSNYPN